MSVDTMQQTDEMPQAFRPLFAQILTDSHALYGVQRELTFEEGHTVYITQRPDKGAGTYIPFHRPKLVASFQQFIDHDVEVHRCYVGFSVVWEDRIGEEACLVQFILRDA